MTVENLKSLWSYEEYALLDFGKGRKLERFGHMILDRPAPAADRFFAQSPQLWSSARLVLGERGQIERGVLDESQPWRVKFRELQFELRLTPFGHVGLFPEHELNWQWLLARLNEQQRSAVISAEAPSPAPRVLNLFAYTGALSLLLAANGCEVSHIDSSAPSVAWARVNAELSRLEAAPIRWLVEDARKYVARELKRGRRYDLIVLDPPTYGHGPAGKAWRIEEDLPDLLASCVALLSGKRSTLLVTGHSSTPNADGVVKQLRAALSLTQAVKLETGRQTLRDDHDRELDSGWFVRMTM